MHLLPGRQAPCLSLALTLALSLGATRAVPAETASAPAVKAAYLYHFAKFAEWPTASLPPGAPIVMCVVDDTRVAKALEDATSGRDAGGHSLVVRRVDLDGPVRTCHVLYANGLDARRATELVDAVKDTPVLSVSDYNSFAQLGGIAHLFVEDGRMRFAVNVDATARSKIRLSSRLLSLAVIVKDDPNVARR
jgi:hypothetical protein